MATTEWYAVIAHGSDAEFRVWGKSMSDALTAVGFIKSADTGQINWATVSRAAVNTAAGYEIRYLNDSLHSTCPIFVKIEWGTDSQADRPQVWLTVATGSNGSGTLNGTTIYARAAIANTVSAGSTTAEWAGAACMTTGSMFLSFGTAASGSAGARVNFGIHRTCDANGTPNGNGAYVWTANSAATILGRQYYRTGATSVAGVGIRGLGDSSRTTLSIGKDIHTLPCAIYTNVPAPCVGVIGVMKGDCAWGQPITQTVLGLVKQYWPLVGAGGVPSTTAPITADGLNTNVTHACLWE